MENKFMCALGTCKEQCYTCEADQKCDTDILFLKRQNERLPLVENAKYYAKELVGKYMFLLDVNFPISKAKHAAQIAIDQVIDGNFGEGYNHDFYLETKKQIDNL